jgi:hypothetical protein
MLCNKIRTVSLIVKQFPQPALGPSCPLKVPVCTLFISWQHIMFICYLRALFGEISRIICGASLNLAQYLLHLSSMGLKFLVAFFFWRFCNT